MHGDELGSDAHADGVEDLAADEMRNRAEELRFGGGRFGDCAVPVNRPDRSRWSQELK
ncbi:hypothetical protein ACIBTP_03125 [Streptomyces avidinii]|uniref:hypothetical protein n=1 Tax=Streptomyces avidinii TaxID=1895 RepID=UPI00379DC864